MPDISVIIPVHTHETAHHALIDFFQKQNVETLVISADTRAGAMNQGAKKASGDFLWFVHADTKLSTEHYTALQKSCAEYPGRIHFFDLAYMTDGPLLTKLNAWGANIRSRLFGLPWGDQGLCCSREVFEKLGGYNENAPYGEDHLFIWAAHHAGIKLNRIAIPLETSARQYRTKGWFVLTLTRQYLWIKQALPQLMKLIKIKVTS